MNRKWIALVLLTLITNTAYAASFDCAKAGTKVEKMICADPELSRLDEKLGEAYSKARDMSSEPNKLKRQQRDWIKERNKCIDSQCLSQRYETRIAELDKITISSKAQDNVSAIDAEYKYPPYPDVWGYELRHTGDESRRVIVGVYQHESGGVDVIYVSFRNAQKRNDGSCCDFEKRYTKLDFFSGKSQPLSVDELNRFGRQNKSIKVAYKKNDSMSFLGDGSVKVRFDNKGSAHCGANFEYSLVKTDSNGGVVARRILLYLRDKPISSPFDPYCENTEGMSGKFLQRVESSRLTLVPLIDGTFIVYENDGDLIVRFDKDFNTKFSNNHMFLVDAAVIERVEKKLLNESRFNRQSLDDAVSAYLTKVHNGED